MYGSVSGGCVRVTTTNDIAASFYLPCYFSRAHPRTPRLSLASCISKSSLPPTETSLEPQTTLMRNDILTERVLPWLGRHILVDSMILSQGEKQDD